VTSTVTSTVGVGDDEAMRTRLGRAVFARMRLPGPPAGRVRPARIGSVATSAARFAAGTSRPVPVRRALAGPEVTPVHRYRDVAVTPPRWWAPTVQYLGAESARHVDAAPAGGRPRRPLHRTAAPVSVSDLPARGLPRAVRRVPNEETWTPGRIADTLTPTVVPVRRMDAVAAAGPMLSSQERAAQIAASAAAPANRRPPPATPPPARPRPQPSAPTTPARPGLQRRATFERSTPRIGAPTAAPPTPPSTKPSPQPSAAPARDQPAPSASLERPAPSAAVRWRPAPSQRFARAVLDARPAASMAEPAEPAGMLTLAPLASRSPAAATRTPLRRTPAPRAPQQSRPGGRNAPPAATAPSIVPPGTAPLRRAIRRGTALRPGLDLSRAPAVGAAPVITRSPAESPVPSPTRPGLARPAGPSAAPSPTAAASPVAPVRDTARPGPVAAPSAAPAARHRAPESGPAAGAPAAAPAGPGTTPAPPRPAARPALLRRADEAGLAITASRGLRAAATEPVELRPATASVELRAGVSTPGGIPRALTAATTTATTTAATRFAAPAGPHGPGPIRRRPARTTELRRRPSPSGRATEIAMPELLPAHRDDTGPRAGRPPALASGWRAVEVIVPSSGRSAATGSGLAAAPPLGRTEAGPAIPASAAATSTVAHLPAPPPISIQRTPAPRGSSAAPAASKPAGAAAGAAAAAGKGEVQRMISLVEQMAQRDLSTTTASTAQGGGAMAQDPTAPVHYTAGGTQRPAVSVSNPMDDPRWFDELVERVVRRVERHVVDELERRGRRYGNGAY